MQRDVVAEGRPHSRKPTGLYALRRVSIERIVEEDAVMSCGKDDSATRRRVESGSRKPGVAPTCPLKIDFFADTKIQITSYHTKLVVVLKDV